MLHMRPFDPDDAAVILSWCRDEYAFRQWSADRYDHYPAVPEDMIRLYAGAKDFYPMTVYDEQGVAGHMTMRFVDEKRQELRFGFVIVDNARRGQGCGRDMLHMALCYAFGVARAQRVSLGVFENNLPAWRCYKAAGFRDAALDQPESYHVLGETWACREMQINREEWRLQEWN